MTDELKRRRILARLDAHAARHPELVDAGQADDTEWLEVLTTLPELATSSPDSPDLATPGSGQVCKSGALPALHRADSERKPSGPQRPSPGADSEE